MVVRVQDVCHEEADGDAERRGAREGQTLNQECDPARPPRLPRPYPGDAAAQGPTPPRLLPFSVGASVGGSGGDANDAERAAHHADVDRQELEPAWHQFGVDLRRSCHRGESGRLQCGALPPPYILNTHTCGSVPVIDTFVVGRSRSQ